MADITKAKAGDTFTEDALKHLAHCGLRLPHAEAHIVKPKAPGTAGQWVCIDCGYLCQNQIDAHNHAEKHGRKVDRRRRGQEHLEAGSVQQHRLAWRNFETGDVEEP